MNTTHAAGQDRAILPPLADGARQGVYTTGASSAPTPTGPGHERIGGRRRGTRRRRLPYQMIQPDRRSPSQPNWPPMRSAP
jgi:hypothetical protein